MTNMEIINALNALAAQTPKIDNSKLYETENKLEREKASIKRYSNKYAVARAHNKGSFSMHFQNETDKAYYALLKNFGSLLPMSDSDGQVGKSFYLATCPEKCEFVKITISRTNGVTAGKNCETTTVSDAQNLNEINNKLRKIEKLKEAQNTIQRLAEKLAETLAILEE